MNYEYLFGPVPSRRLGVSLGVDLVQKKTCNLDCVYCECGRTQKTTCERKSYVNKEKVIAEIKHFLSEGSYLDFITFSGWGEPTLNSDIGEIIDEIKKITDIKIAVITNGTTLWDNKVREALLKADVVMPSLDAVSNEIFQKINRPDKEVDITKVIDGIVEFSKLYKGELKLEIFVIDGINNSSDEIAKFREVIFKIAPSVVQINSLDRPAAENWVKKAETDILEEFKEKLGYEKSEIISKYKSRENIKNYTQKYEELILNMIEKRPCTIEDISEVTGIKKAEINKYIDVLEKEKKVKTILGERGVFVRKEMNQI